MFVVQTHGKNISGWNYTNLFAHTLYFTFTSLQQGQLAFPFVCVCLALQSSLYCIWFDEIGFESSLDIV